MNISEKTKQAVTEFLSMVEARKNKIQEKKNDLIKQANDITEKLNTLNKQYVDADLADDERKVNDLEKKMTGLRVELLGLEDKIKTYDEALNDKSQFEADAEKIIKIAAKEIGENYWRVRSLAEESKQLHEEKEKLEKKIKEVEREKDMLSGRDAVIALHFNPVAAYIPDTSYSDKDRVVVMLRRYAYENGFFQ
ncbi:MAG: hypothetical protein ACOYVK_14690 [Bacillota bacterium]